MFSVVLRFSSPVSLIRLGGFSPGPHLPSTIPRSTELASEEGGNCNKRDPRSGEFPKRKSRDNNHPDFTPVSLTSTTTPHRVWLPFGASGPLLDLRTRLLLLRTQLPLTLRTRPRIYVSRKDIPLGYLQIVHLSRHEAGSSSGVTQ